MNRKIVNKRLDALCKALGIFSAAFGMLVVLILFADVFLDGA